MTMTKSMVNLKVNDKDKNNSTFFVFDIAWTQANVSTAMWAFQSWSFHSREVQCLSPCKAKDKDKKKQKQRQQKTIDMSLSQNYTELHKISLNYTTFIPILRQKSHETAVAIVSLLLFFDCLFDCSDCFYLFCFFNHVNHFPSLMFVHLFVCFVQYSCFLLVHSRKCKPTFLKQLTSCSWEVSPVSW